MALRFDGHLATSDPIYSADPSLRAQVWTVEEYDVCAAGTPRTVFLHRVRALRSTEPDYCTSSVSMEYYSKHLPWALDRFRQMLESAALTDVDAVVMPPSRRRDAEPYMAVAKGIFPSAEDLTRSFSLQPANSTGGSTTVSDALRKIAVTEAATDFSRYRHVVLVDDVFAAGHVATAMILRMRERHLSATARVTVACPLRVLQSRRVVRDAVNDIFADILLRSPSGA